MLNAGTKYRNVVYSAIMPMLLVFIGYGIGLMWGNASIRSFLAGEGKASTILFRPAYEIYHSYRLINSDNELDRLSGYYSILDINLMDEDFLVYRYAQERSDSIKRTIIWVISFSSEKEKVYQFYDKVYKDSDSIIQGEIVRSLSRLDKKRSDEFIKKYKINYGLQGF